MYGPRVIIFVVCLKTSYFYQSAHMRHSSRTIFSGCKPRAVNKPCYQIRNRQECLTSIDTRRDFKDQNCVWCLTNCPHGNVCEPQTWLEQNHAKKEGKDFETCFTDPGIIKLSSLWFNIVDVFKKEFRIKKESMNFPKLFEFEVNNFALKSNA